MRRIVFRHDSGLTLLELVFAVGVVGVALAFLFGSLVNLSVASNMTQNRAIAATHLATVMEEFKTLDFAQQLAYVPPLFQNLGPSEVVQLEIVLADGSTINLPVDPLTVGVLPNPMLVRCTVNWLGTSNRPLTLDASQFFQR